MFQQDNVESRNWTYHYRSDLVFRFSWDIVLSPFSDPKIHMFESLDFCWYARPTVPIYMFPLHQGSLLRLNQCVALCAFSLIFVGLCSPHVSMEIVWTIDKSAQRSPRISPRHVTSLWCRGTGTTELSNTNPIGQDYIISPSNVSRETLSNKYWLWSVSGKQCPIDYWLVWFKGLVDRRR